MKVRGLFFLIFIFSFLINNLSAQSSPQFSEEEACFPLWVFEDSLYVGMSDPFVSYDKAKQQAVERALFFYAIKNKGVSILEISELYEKTKGEVNNVRNDKMLQTILFSVGLKNVVYEIEKQWQSENGEVFVCLKVGSGSRVIGSCDFAAVLKRDIYEDAIISKSKKDLHLKFYAKCSAFESTESFWEKNDEQVNCIWQDTLVNYSKDYLFYGKNCRGGKELNSFALKYSFWASLFESFSESLFTYTMKNLKVASMQTVYGNRIEELISMNAVDVLKCDWRKRGVKDSKLLLNWIISEM